LISREGEVDSKQAALNSGSGVECINAIRKRRGRGANYCVGTRRSGGAQLREKIGKERKVTLEGKGGGG